MTYKEAIEIIFGSDVDTRKLLNMKSVVEDMKLCDTSQLKELKEQDCDYERLRIIQAGSLLLTLNNYIRIDVVSGTGYDIKTIPTQTLKELYIDKMSSEYKKYLKGTCSLSSIKEKLKEYGN